ncbi:MAG: hypothetical protein A2Y10_19935 [Planctomycetes bacterium GWF2_41_51]|nr:MAG: hypothetical protein A2Y10_19935 [Planctomycetes bacterium GWF2_41_51]HBG28556.1 hypothetical protein [Phycisphaerales bacterium]
MKNLKILTLVLLVVIFFLPAFASAAFTQEVLVGAWDMSGTTSLKTVSVLENDPCTAAFFASESRNYLPDSNGDIIFGTFIIGTAGSAPSLTGGHLVFSGAENAYIENAVYGVHSVEVEFDFTTNNISQAAIILGTAGGWEVRIEPGEVGSSNEGKARLDFYCSTIVDNVIVQHMASSNWTVTTGANHHVKISVKEDSASIELDSVVSGSAKLDGGMLLPANPHLHLGSKWNGGESYFSGTIDNISVKKYEAPLIGDWPMLSSTLTNKDVNVPVDFINPNNTVRENRSVLADANGDVVLGKWVQGNLAFLDNPGAYDDMLDFTGLQMAYIPEIFENRTSFQIDFDYKPMNLFFSDSSQTILHVPDCIEVRTEPGTGLYAGKYRLMFPAFTNLNGVLTARTPRSEYIIEEGKWYHVSCWVDKSRAYISVDGIIDDLMGGGLERGLNPAIYGNLFMGAKWNASGRFMYGQLKNIKLTEFDEWCGAWGFVASDLNYDCKVDFKDLAIIAESWMKCTDPQGVGCVSI